MPRQVLPVARKDHRPQDVSRAAVQLAVDEIPEAAEEESLRSTKCERVSDGPERNVPTAREHDDGDSHPQYRAVKRESALPYGEGIWRMCFVGGEIVEKDIDESRPDQHSDEQVHDQRIHCCFAERNESAADATLGNDDSDRVSDEVHDAVPAERERTDPENLRPYVRKWDRHPESGSDQQMHARATALGGVNCQGVSLISRAPKGRAK